MTNKTILPLAALAFGSAMSLSAQQEQKKPNFILIMTDQQQDELLKELLKWEIATTDQIPVPRNRYYFKRNPHNYLFYKE